jgi:hypothetical protein
MTRMWGMRLQDTLYETHWHIYIFARIKYIFSNNFYRHPDQLLQILHNLVRIGLKVQIDIHVDAKWGPHLAFKDVPIEHMVGTWINANMSIVV